MGGPDRKGADRSDKQRQRRTTDETGCPCPIEFTWEKREIGPQENYLSDPPGWLEFHFSRSLSVPGENLLFHYSSCMFGAGPSLSRTDVGAQRPADPTGQPQLSSRPSARPALPLWLSLGGPAHGGSPLCCSRGPGAPGVRGEG